MELPMYSPRTLYCEGSYDAGTARVGHHTAFLGTPHSPFCWKSSFSAQRVTIAPPRSPLLLRSVDFSVVFKASPPLPPSNSSSLRYKGKRRDPHSISSPGRSDAIAVQRSKDDAFAVARQQTRHHPSSKNATALAGSKALSSAAVTSKSGSKDISSGEYSIKPKFSGEASTNTTISTERSGNSVLRRDSKGKQLWSRETEASSGVDRLSFKKGTANLPTWKKTSSSKELYSASSDRETEEGSSLRPVLSRARSARSYKKKRHKYSALSQAQAEGQKAKKREEAKERVAMAEANGFRLSKRSKKNPEEVQHVLKLNLCSKHGDLHGALAIYDSVKKGETFNLKQHHYNVLLYICSGAASGSIAKGRSGKDERTLTSATIDTNKNLTKGSEESMEEASKGEGDAINVDVVSFSAGDMQLAARRGTEIYKDMLQAKVPPNEATFTAVARLAVAKGDGDLAFETVKKMAAAGITPKLRSYGPALLCFCEHNQIAKAFEVDDHMAAAGILPDENLLEALLKLSVATGLEDKVYSLLQRLRKTVRDVSPTTAMTIKRWFDSEAAASAGNSNCDNIPSKEDILEAAESRGGGWHGLGWLGKGKWMTKRTNVSKAGVCQSCGEILCAIDLDPEETEKFARSVAELAMQREHNANEFVTFQEWLESSGPFEAILDGANIGMYNSALRGFNYNQVSTVASAIKARSLTKKPPLIVLHRRRTSDGVSRSPRSQNIIDSWISENVLYSTPQGSNDDWYWLYAAVKCKSLLVTNDEMRDHLFELLGNNFFPKWKERHQVRFTFSANGLELLMPPPYSTIIQESQHGSWHIPKSGGDDLDSPQEWLCVTRSNMKSTTLEDKIDLQMVSNEDINKSASDMNSMSPLREEGKECLSQVSETEHSTLMNSSDTLLKLEAAERLSDGMIAYEI